MSQVESKPVDQQRTVGALIQLLGEATSDEVFYEKFLRALPVPDGTIQAIAWRFERESQSLKRISGWAMANTPHDLPIGKDVQARMMAAVIAAGEPELYDLSSLDGNSNPSLVAFIPIRSTGGVVAVVQAFLSTEVTFPTAKTFLARADLMCGIATSFHNRSPEKVDSDKTPSFVQLVGQIHKSLNVQETSYAIANETRRATECDRASVLVRRGDRYRVLAVSGQETVNKRANTITSIQQLAERTTAVNEPFWYPHEAQSVPPEIEVALEQHLDLSLCRTIGIVPLFAANHSDDPTEEELPSDIPRKPIGALVVEHFSEFSGGADALSHPINIIGEQAGIALGNAKAHEGIFLLPVWRWIGGWRRYFEGKRRVKTVSGLAAAVAIVVALCLIPSSFRIASEGRLLPTTRCNVFAPMDGTVEKLLVNQNDDVEAGQELLRLKSDPLELELRKLEGERLTLQTSIDAIQARRLVTRRDQESSALDAAAAELEDLRKQLESVNRQLELRQAMRDELVVRSPISGRVITWNLAETLDDRPVVRGQLLLEIVDTNGKWGLELELPDRRIVHVLRADANSEEPLPVTFILASDPGQKLQGTLADFEKRTNRTNEAEQYVRINVNINREEVQFQQPGTKVQAKIDCGTRSTLYVWLHDILEFIQSRILFRLG